MPKGYSLDALANVVYPCARNSLSSEDLNTLSTPDYFGVYGQAANANATPERNYPVPQAGTLEVLPQTGGGCTQRYTIYSGDMDFYIRHLYNGVWGAWRRFRSFDLMFTAIYPVGSILMFEGNQNPNNMFPGTTWVQRTTGRVIRAANSSTVGTAVGNIGATTGSDSITLGTAQLPAHAHTMAHTHEAAAHTHSVGAHAHPMPHTHTMAHTHSTPNHTHSGTAASAGAHTHPIDLNAQGMNSNGSGGYGKIATGNEDVEGTIKIFNTNSAGAHTHTVSIDSGGGGTTGGSSAANTGGVSTANTSNSTAFNTGGASELTTGGSSAANTGNAGSGSAINITNSSVYYAVWARTA